MKTRKARKRKRRIAVVTGTRADYGLLRSTMAAIQGRSDLHLQVVVTGMHLLRKFGHTVDRIVQDGWQPAARVKMQAGDDSPLDQAEGLSRGVSGIAKFLEQGKTDLVVVLGDRIEALAGALAAVTTGRIVAHIHGGDIAPGDFDDSIRHAITKLAHVHLAATRASARRIIRMGEPARCVHWVGAPGLDRLTQLLDERAASKKRIGRALIVQHACGRSATLEGGVMSAALRAVERAGLARTIVYPNSDRGHAGIIKAIESHGRRSRNGSVRLVRSLDYDDYLRLLIDVDVLVGNSSSGIIEAAAAGTPSVNIGPRQQGRERSGPSVVDSAETALSIRDAIHVALRKRPITGKRSVYGDGRAGEHIAAILGTVPLDDCFRRTTATL